MKWEKILVVASTLVAGGCLAQTAHIANETVGGDSNYSIRVTAPTGRIQSSSPIDITVVVTNISNKEVAWRSVSGDTAYRAFRVVLTKDRREVETTFLHRKVTGRLRSDDPIEVGGGSSLVSALSPGNSATFTINLQRLYKISDPGEYTLEVTCNGCYDDASKSVRAKPLTLKIVR